MPFDGRTLSIKQIEIVGALDEPISFCLCKRPLCSRLNAKNALVHRVPEWMCRVLCSRNLWNLHSDGAKCVIVCENIKYIKLIDSNDSKNYLDDLLHADQMMIQLCNKLWKWSQNQYLECVVLTYAVTAASSNCRNGARS